MKYFFINILYDYFLIIVIVIILIFMDVRGSTQKMIEDETGVKIRIPLSKKDDSISKSQRVQVPAVFNSFIIVTGHIIFKFHSGKCEYADQCLSFNFFPCFSVAVIEGLSSESVSRASEKIQAIIDEVSCL